MVPSLLNPTCTAGMIDQLHAACVSWSPAAKPGLGANPPRYLSEHDNLGADGVRSAESAWHLVLGVEGMALPRDLHVLIAIQHNAHLIRIKGSSIKHPGDDDDDDDIREQQCAGYSRVLSARLMQHCGRTTHRYGKSSAAGCSPARTGRRVWYAGTAIAACTPTATHWQQADDAPTTPVTCNLAFVSYMETDQHTRLNECGACLLASKAATNTFGAANDLVHWYAQHTVREHLVLGRGLQRCRAQS